jgi:hypothetical protein
MTQRPRRPSPAPPPTFRAMTAYWDLSPAQARQAVCQEEPQRYQADCREPLPPVPRPVAVRRVQKTWAAEEELKAQMEEAMARGVSARAAYDQVRRDHPALREQHPADGRARLRAPH